MEHAKSMKTVIARYKYPLALACSVLCALAAIGLARNYLEMKEREILQSLTSKQNLVEVVVAKRDLAVGSEINAQTMSLKKIPEEYLPGGVVRPDRFSEVEGMTISVPIGSGRPLMRHDIKNIARVDKFSDLLGPGERALTLEVDGTSSAEYMLEAGDVIDLAIKSRSGDRFAPLLERVTVLATGKVTTADPKAPNAYKRAEYQTLTIGVDSAKVAPILLADSRKELVFLLRNESDKARSRYLVDAGRTIEVIVGGSGEEAGLTVRTEAAVARRSSPVIGRNAEGQLLRKAAAPSRAAVVEPDREVALVHEEK